MPSRTPEKEKITVSLPVDLIRYADERAAAQGITRSHIIGQAVARLRALDEEALAREGYEFYAEESVDFARVSLRATSEAIVHASD